MCTTMPFQISSFLNLISKNTPHCLLPTPSTKQRQDGQERPSLRDLRVPAYHLIQHAGLTVSNYTHYRTNFSARQERRSERRPCKSRAPLPPRGQRFCQYPLSNWYGLTMQRVVRAADDVQREMMGSRRARIFPRASGKLYGVCVV